MQDTSEAQNTASVQNTSAADNGAADQLRELSAALVEAQTKLALLMNGASCSSLEEGARFALGLVGVGMAPEDAAQRTMEVYPHLRLTKRELPVFSAETKGSDGFAAIRSIFARR